MEEEIKKAYMDWSEKGVSYLNCMYVYDTMMDVDEALQTCDTILDEIDLGIDYTSRKKDIDKSSPNLCVNSSFSYISPSMLPLSSGDLIEWSLVCHSILSYQKFCD